MAGAEKENQRWLVAREISERVDLGWTFKMIWGDGRTRLFFLFLFVATASVDASAGTLADSTMAMGVPYVPKHQFLADAAVPLIQFIPPAPIRPLSSRPPLAATVSWTKP